MTSLRHRFESGSALLLDHGNVLSPEGMPAEAFEIETETFCRRTDDIWQNRSIIHRLSPTLKHILLGFGARVAYAIDILR